MTFIVGLLQGVGRILLLIQKRPKRRSHIFVSKLALEVGQEEIVLPVL